MTLRKGGGTAGEVRSSFHGRAAVCAVGINCGCVVQRQVKSRLSCEMRRCRRKDGAGGGGSGGGGGWARGWGGGERKGGRMDGREGQVRIGRQRQDDAARGCG